MLVTHDPEEAAFLADEVIVISDGRTLQAGPPRDLFTRPSSPEVARLLGTANLHRAVVDSDGWIDAAGMRIAAPTGDLAPSTPVLWSISPERVSLLGSGGLPGTVSDVADLGTSFELFVSLAAGLEIVARTTERRGSSRATRATWSSPARRSASGWTSRGGPRRSHHAENGGSGRHGHLDPDIGGLDHGVGDHSRLQVQLVDRLAGDERHTRWGPAWISTWAATPVLGHPGHDPAEPIAGRLTPRPVAAPLPAELDGQAGQVRVVDVAPAPRSLRRLHPSGVGPAAHGVGADPQ